MGQTWTRRVVRASRELLAGVAVGLILWWLFAIPTSGTAPAPEEGEGLRLSPRGVSAGEAPLPEFVRQVFPAEKDDEEVPGDWDIMVYDAARKEVVSMPLEEYLCGVVAAEMPAAYQGEALKAQAVAARTYTAASMRRNGGAGCGKADTADVCTSPAHCQAYSGKGALREKWGEDYRFYWERITSAVAATHGEVVTYQGMPIHALYHAVSGGRTEDAKAVFNMRLPYLVSVESAGEENAPRYRERTSFARAELAALLNEAYPKAKLSAGKLQGQIEIKSRLQSGQVEKVRIGGTTISGVAFRKAAGIPSANFSMAYDEKQVVITTQGYGHGVGMSQAGANAMAGRGCAYREILGHYYAGTEVTVFSYR